jgi:hypothetical protein
MRDPVVAKASIGAPASWRLIAVLWVASLTTPVMAADPPRKADRCTKVEPAKGTPEVPGGDIFGFSNPSDIGDPCEWYFASEHTGFADKRDGRFFTLVSKSELSYTYSQNLAFAFSVFNIYNRWSNVTVLQDALASAGAGVEVTGLKQLQFDGLSTEVLWRLLARSPGQPVAVTAAMEPRWSRIEFSTGYPAQFFANEFKLLLDVALTDRLFAAMNLIYAIGTQKLGINEAPWVENSLTLVSGALTARVYTAEKALIEGVFLGVEGRFLSLFEGLFLNKNLGNAFFAGPTLAIAFRNDRTLNLVWTPQLAGRAHPASAPGPLDLDNFERHQFRIKFDTPLN